MKKIKSGSEVTNEALRSAGALLQAKKLVVFIGAGLSSKDTRAWRMLINDLCQKCGVVPDTTDLLDLADRCADQNTPACNEFFCERFPRHPENVRTDLTYVCKLPFRSIITTNFEPWIRYQTSLDMVWNVDSYPCLSMTDGIQSRLYYIHGYFDGGDSDSSISDLVLGTRSFIEAYDNGVVGGFLLNIFLFENILFLGIRPTEEKMAGIIAKADEMRARQNLLGKFSFPEVSRFLFAKSPAPDDDAEKAYLQKVKSMNIDLIDSGPAHSKTSEILFGWLNRFGGEKSPPGFTGGMS